MRQFTTDEKNLIRDFVWKAEDSATFVLTNIFNDWFNGTDLAFDGENLLFDRNIGAEQLLGYEKCIIFRALLIKYLIDNAYIYIVEDGSTVNPTNTIGDLENEKLTAKKQLPRDVADILGNVNNRVFVTENLKILVKNDFKTFEELSLKESKKQTKIALWSLVLAIVAIIVSSVTISFDNSCTSYANDDCCCCQENDLEYPNVLDSIWMESRSIKELGIELAAKIEPQVETKYVTKYKTKYVNQPATYKVACGDSLELIQVKK